MKTEKYDGRGVSELEVSYKYCEVSSFLRCGIVNTNHYEEGARES